MKYGISSPPFMSNSYQSKFLGLWSQTAGFAVGSAVGSTVGSDVGSAVKLIVGYSTSSIAI